MKAEKTELITAEQLAQALSTTTAAIRMRRLRGQLPPAIRIGRRSIRWRRCDIDAWLKEQEEAHE